MYSNTKTVIVGSYALLILSASFARGSELERIIEFQEAHSPRGARRVTALGASAMVSYSGHSQRQLPPPPPYPFNQQSEEIGSPLVTPEYNPQQNVSFFIPSADEALENPVSRITTLVKDIEVALQKIAETPKISLSARKRKKLPATPSTSEPTYYDKQLYKAISENNTERAKSLLLPKNKPERAANPNTLFSKGTALHAAVINRYEESVKVLCDYKKTNPNIRDSQGNTPLHYATTDEITYLLIKKGADPTILNNMALDAREYARLAGKSSLAMIMETALEKEKRAHALELFRARASQEKTMEAETLQESLKCLACIEPLPPKLNERFAPFSCGHTEMCKKCFEESWKKGTKVCVVCRADTLEIAVSGLGEAIDQKNPSKPAAQDDEAYMELLALSLDFENELEEDEWL